LKPTGTRSDSATEPAVREEVIRLERQRRKQRIRTTILVCLGLFVLLTFLETRVVELGEVKLPVSGNLLIFVLINVNVLLLLVVIFLTLRNLVQLVFERKRRILGTRLKTKLVIAFVSLSLIPTFLLFFVALQFVSTSMDYWFNTNVEGALLESLNIAREVYEETKESTVRQGRSIAEQLESPRYRYMTADYLDEFLGDLLVSHGLAGIEVIGPDKSRVAAVYAEPLREQVIPDLPPELLAKTLAGESGLVTIQPVVAGELVRGLTMVNLGGEETRQGVLVISRLIPTERLWRMQTISSGLEGYRQLMMLKAPIKTSLIVMLLIVTLLIVFAAIWFGFYVASGLTGPIKNLAEATRRVADGDLDFVLTPSSGDEMGTLVDSFNQMTRDLLASRREIERTSQELDNRRRYTEIILRNVAAGVISLDADGRITTINRFAEDLLKVRADEILGRHYRSILRYPHLSVLEGFLDELARSGKNAIERPLRLAIGEETFSLRVNFTRLMDDDGKFLGVVLVFDNLTELEKAQRMAAWREVARRIAHEVKNPLTPIQLSAQRLRKKYLDKLPEDTEVFDLCTKTIITQVEELKKLVAEFSSFARMPAVQKAMNDLGEMIREVLALYREAHREIVFEFVEEGELPPFLFDLKQMKRVFINLLDNSVAAVPPKGGKVVVRAGMDAKGERVFLEVCDNGPGVSEDVRQHLFEPYFSTKKSGTGLGLAIASTVVADHDGSIRVKENTPHGACFVVDLPFSRG